MKKYINQLLVIAVLIIVGCSDPCKEVVCGPGTCDDGTCICPDGYIGTSCETLEIAKYFGLFNITPATCSNGAPLILETVDLGEKTDEGPFDIVMTLEGGTTVISMEGTLNGGKLEGTAVTSGEIKLTLTGEFSDEDTFTGIYMTSTDISCDFVMSK